MKTKGVVGETMRTMAAVVLDIFCPYKYGFVKCLSLYSKDFE